MLLFLSYKSFYTPVQIELFEANTNFAVFLISYARMLGLCLSPWVS